MVSNVIIDIIDMPFCKAVYIYMYDAIIFIDIIYYCCV